MNFPTDLAEIDKRIAAIEPADYGRTRNFKSGALTYLSPYISRGVISTKYVFDKILARDLPWNEMEKLVQELAWRDYWQLVWIAKGDGINEDLKQEQAEVTNHKIPAAIVNGATGIVAVDEAIQELKDTGYMHNHMRMYVASIACNISGSHWLAPARWMYSLLKDGDWASNALSWQWVAGANANKKYYANQENINKYFESEQRDTFLDVSYDNFENLAVPEVLKDLLDFECSTQLPAGEVLNIDSSKKTLVYNYYNLDPYWHADLEANRMLLLELSFFEKYPITQNCLDFALALAKNSSGIQIFVGSFEELKVQLGASEIIYKEHPTNAHYKGTEEPRDWMTAVEGYYPSFFKFWNKAKKELKKV